MALQGSNLVESLAGVVTGMLIFSYQTSFLLFERLPAGVVHQPAGDSQM